MDVNKIKILTSDLEKGIVVPIGMNWDFLDRESTIKTQEQEIIKEVIGIPTNYELSRFRNLPNGPDNRQLNYNFHFTTNVTGPWEISYLTKFTDLQVRYRTDAYKKSFFKLDFYNSMDPKTQKNYLSVILQTSQSYVELPVCKRYRWTSAFEGTITFTNCCNTEEIVDVGSETSYVFCASEPSVIIYSFQIPTFDEQSFELPVNGTLYELIIPGPPNILFYRLLPLETICNCDGSEESSQQNSELPLSRPTFSLDGVGNQEGFFLHWFEDRNLLNIDTLYMTAKFFDAATGQFTKFIDTPQTDFSNPYRVPNIHFYHTVNFNYDNKTYRIISNQTDLPTNNVLWFEYINPPIG